MHSCTVAQGVLTLAIFLKPHEMENGMNKMLVCKCMQIKSSAAVSDTVSADIVSILRWLQEENLNAMARRFPEQRSE